MRQLLSQSSTIKSSILIVNIIVISQVIVGAIVIISLRITNTESVLEIDTGYIYKRVDS